MKQTVLFAALVHLVTACGAPPITGMTRVETPPSPVVRAHKALLIVPEADKPDWNVEARALAGRAARELEGAGLFSAVIEAGPDSEAQKAEIELVIHVTHELKVTASERENLGKGAGQVEMQVKVAIRDRIGKTDLGRATFDASGYVGKHGGTTEDAEDEIEGRIVTFVTGRSAAP